MASLELPPPVQPGDPIRVIAPSGPFEHQTFEAGLARLSRFELRVAAGLAARRSGFLAGSDAERLRELQAALDEPGTRAVWIARGGYGLGRLIAHLDFSGFRRNPKWICGFSDATSLHQAALSAGFASLHAPNVTSLARLDTADEARLFLALSGAALPETRGLAAWTRGVARGPLVGGNLTVLFAEAAAGAWEPPPGAILFLEDVTETSYRIDRMLSSLARRGTLRSVAGVVLGDFTHCSPGKFSVPVEDVLREQLTQLGIPVVADFPAGHGARQHPFVHGCPVHLDAAAGTLRWLGGDG